MKPNSKNENTVRRAIWHFISSDAVKLVFTFRVRRLLVDYTTYFKKGNLQNEFKDGQVDLQKPLFSFL